VRIVVDMQGAQSSSRFRGIGRFTMSMVHALVRNVGDHEIVLVLNGLLADTIEPIRAAFNDQLPVDAVRVWHAPGPTIEREGGNGPRREVAEVLREAFIASLEPDIIVVMSLFEGFRDNSVTSIGRFSMSAPVAVVFYDLIPLLNAVQYLDPDPDYRAHYHRKLADLRRARLIMAISDAAKDEAVTHAVAPGATVITTPLAADDHFRQVHITAEQERSLRDRFGLPKPYVMYSGGADERKNLVRLVRAFGGLEPAIRDAYQLLLAGPIGDLEVAILRGEAERGGLAAGSLVFTGFASEDDLVALYNLCHAFVFPSWHEGFGLPPLEAMACGAPVIGSNVSSIPEVIARADALFDPFDEGSIRDRLTQVLSDEGYRQSLIRHGLVNARRYSWDASARSAIGAFEDLVAAHPRGSRPPEPVLTADLVVAAIVECIEGADLSAEHIARLAAAIAQNHPEPNRRSRFYLDVTELVRHDARSGIQRVVRSMLIELLRAQPPGFDVHAIFAAEGEPGYRLARFVEAGKTPGVVASDDTDLVEFQPGDVFLGLHLQHHATIYLEEYLAAIRRNGTRVWFVVYDLLPVRFPHYWPVGHPMPEVHSSWLDVIAKFDGVACISKAVADEYIEWVGDRVGSERRPLQVGWFHLGADIQSSVPSTGVPDDAQRTLAAIGARTSFVMVGTLEPRKGHTQALDAFEQLWSQGHDLNLVIVGRHGWMLERLCARLKAHPERGSRLFWLEGASDEYLERIYAASSCLLAPSEGEGFGLPLVEAAQHALPILARDLPVFREVAGDHAFYFTGSEPSSLATAVLDWVSLKESDAHPRSEGMPHLTWRESAAQLVSTILEGRAVRRVPAGTHTEASAHRSSPSSPAPKG